MSSSPLSYDAWRISYQSSEQAAREAYALYLEALTASQANAPRGFDFERMFNVAANEITEIGRAAGVRPEDQLNGSFEILVAIRAIQQRRDHWRHKAEQAEEHLAIARRANKNLTKKLTKMIQHAHNAEKATA